MAFILSNWDMADTCIMCLDFELRPSKRNKPQETQNRIKWIGETKQKKSVDFDVVLINPKRNFVRVSASLKALACHIQQKPPTGKKLKVYTVNDSVVGELHGCDISFTEIGDDNSLSVGPNTGRNRIEADIVAVVGQDQRPGARMPNVKYLADVVANRGIPLAFVVTPDDCIVPTDGPYGSDETNMISWCTDKNEVIASKEANRS